MKWSKSDYIKKVMKKYGDNNWWLSGDPVEVAKNQIFEDILLVPFSTFHKGMEMLLGRPVWTHEFGLSWDKLQAEVKVIVDKEKSICF